MASSDPSVQHEGRTWAEVLTGVTSLPVASLDDAAVMRRIMKNLPDPHDPRLLIERVTQFAQSLAAPAPRRQSGGSKIIALAVPLGVIAPLLVFVSLGSGHDAHRPLFRSVPGS